MSLANKLFRAAFDEGKCRTPRSEPYKQGVLDVLRFRSGEDVTMQGCPYGLGTAQADAWFSGNAEGHSVWRRHLEGVA